MIDCPQCGSDEIIYEDGFAQCTVCDYSEAKDEDADEEQDDFSLLMQDPYYDDDKQPIADFDILAVE